eukprot:g2460.t1
MPNVIAVVVPFVFGCAFFFGFYFGMIEKDIEHNDDIDDMLARTLHENSMLTSSSGNGGVPCWYDPEEDTVQFTEPNDSAKVNEDRGWAGAVFGLLGWLVSIIMLIICIVNNPCECCVRDSSSSSSFNKEYYENTEDESAPTSSSAMELPTSTAVAVPLPSQGELPVASATAVP